MLLLGLKKRRGKMIYFYCHGYIKVSLDKKQKISNSGYLLGAVEIRQKDKGRKKTFLYNVLYF